MSNSRKFVRILLCLVLGMMVTSISGLAYASDWMNVRLGLAPLKFDPSGQSQHRYLQTVSNAPDTQTSAGAAGGDDKPLDLEELSKKMDNPLGSLWILWIQNDTITIKGFPLKKTQTINNTLLQPILPVQLTKDWIWMNRPVFSFMSVPTPKLDKSGQGAFPDQFPGGGPSFDNIC